MPTAIERLNTSLLALKAMCKNPASTRENLQQSLNQVIDNIGDFARTIPSVRPLIPMHPCENVQAFILIISESLAAHAARNISNKIALAPQAMVACEV